MLLHIFFHWKTLCWGLMLNFPILCFFIWNFQESFPHKFWDRNFHEAHCTLRKKFLKGIFLFNFDDSRVKSQGKNDSQESKTRYNNVLINSYTIQAPPYSSNNVVVILIIREVIINFKEKNVSTYILSIIS